MKLYNGFSPNGFRVAAFMHEKGIEIPVEPIDVMKGEARTLEHIARNSLGEIPVLELDDGNFLTESVAICRYLESQHPQNPLMGKDALESAKVEMWNRRIEQQIMGCMAHYGLHTIPFFADKIEQMPDYAESQKRMFAKNLAWLNQELSDGRQFVAGDQFSIADITGMAALMISEFTNIALPNDLKYVQRWAQDVKSRPSYSVFNH